MTGLRAYMIDTLCTIWVYDYLPKNRHVSGMSLILEHNETEEE